MSFVLVVAPLNLQKLDTTKNINLIVNIAIYLKTKFVS
jgi:hypothetical protein